MGENKNVEVEVQETEKKGFGTKVKEFFAKHGTKIVAVGAALGAGAAGYFLGKNAGSYASDAEDEQTEFYGDVDDEE